MNIRVKQALAIIVGFIVGGVMVMLGIWQTARYNESMADVAAQRVKEPPVTLLDHVHPDGSIDDVYGRRATVTGEFLPDHGLFVGEHWPMRFAQPMKLSDGHVLAVVLGTVRSDDKPTVPPGKVTLTGVFTAGDVSRSTPVPSDAPTGSLPSLRLQTLVQTWPEPVIGGYITLVSEDAARYGFEPATPILPEPQGSEMHRGYALQWWVFAVAAVLFGFVVARGLTPKPSVHVATDK